MVITAEYLKEQIAQLERVIIANSGAIEFAQHLLSVIENNNAMTVSDFAQAIGGNGATAEITPLEAQDGS